MKIRIDLKVLFFLLIFYITKQLKIYLLIMGFAFLHELAHIIIGIILKIRFSEIELITFGFWASLEPNIIDYRKTFLKSNMVEVKYIFVALAGPILNFILAIIFLSVNRNELAYSNLALFLLNVIPIYPLDGGRICKSIFKILLGRKKAEKVCNVLTNTSIITLTICGIIGMIYLNNIAIIVILLFLWDLSLRENKRFKLKEKYSKLSN